jgi:hypothetical protein
MQGGWWTAHDVRLCGKDAVLTIHGMRSLGIMYQTQVADRLRGGNAAGARGIGREPDPNP